MTRLTPGRRPALLALSFAGMLLYISPLLGAEATEPAAILSSTLVITPDALDLDLAKLRAHARIVHVSSGARPFAVRMIDSDGRTAFRFSGYDLHPTVIVQLAQNEKLHRVTAMFQANATRLDVYLTNELPRDAGAFRSLQPTASTTEFDDNGKAVVDFAPQAARYVALRWTRSERGGEPFKVTEICAFGGLAFSFVELDSGTPLPGEPVVVLPVVPVVSPN